MERTLEELLEIKKALSANDGITDIADLRDGSALSQQWIDGIMASLVSSDDDFEFIRNLPRRDVNQTIAEYNQIKSHGGSRYYRTSHVSQSGDPHFADPYIKRMWDEMSYLSEGYEYTRVIEKTNTLAVPEATAATSGMRRMLECVSTSIWHGDRRTLSVEMDGLLKKTAVLGSDFVYDCRGTLPGADVLAHYANQIRSRQFGVASDFYMPYGTKSLFDQSNLGDKQYIFNEAVSDRDGIMISRTVKGTRISTARNAQVLFRTDLWLDDSQVGPPMDYNRATDQYIESSVGKGGPDMPTVAVSASMNVPGSKWGSADAGMARFRVVAMNGQGASLASAPLGAPVAARGAITLNITPAGTGEAAECFVILRETRDGTGDYRKIARIPRTGVAATVFVDLNDVIPGCADGLMGDFNARGTGNEMSTIVLSELMPPLKTSFPPGVRSLRMNVGMIEYYPVIQNKAPQKFVVFKNLPVM